MNKWDRRYLELAQHVASWSKDPSTKCGAVIVRPDLTIASLGFNGFARGVDDDDRLLDRETKYKLIIHAEMNAILSAAEPVKGYTLYIWPYMACERCAVHVIQAGIARVVHPKIPEDKKSRWEDSLKLAANLFAEAGIMVNEYDL